MSVKRDVYIELWDNHVMACYTVCINSKNILSKTKKVAEGYV